MDEREYLHSGYGQTMPITYQDSTDPDNGRSVMLFLDQEEDTIALDSKQALALIRVLARFLADV